MRRILATAVLMSFLLTSAGCAAKRLMERGDAAMLADEPVRARTYYRQAVQKDPDLARKPEFVARMNHIASRAAYVEGQKLAEAGKWEAAAGRYEECTRLDPKFAPAAEQLANSRREASRVRHRAALKLADEGRLSDAVTELRRALELDPHNADAKEALDSINEQSRARSGEGLREYRKALALQKERRWGQAADAFGASVKLAPNHLPSRLGSHHARKTIASARADYQRGRNLLGKRKLGDAVAALEASQKAWPFLTGAAETLGRARAQLQRADLFYAAAADADKKSDWPASAEAAADALAVYPFHRQAGPLYERVRFKAADVHTAAGAKLLAGGKPDAAEAELLQAVRHVPDKAEARSLLGDICRRRADWAEAGKLWGAALLWRMDAADWARSGDDDKALTRAREAIRDRITFAVSVDVAAAGRARRDDADALERELTVQVAKQRPDFIHAPTDKGDFAAAVKLTSLTINQRRTRSEKRTHDYKIAREEPNPEIPRLQTLIESTQRELHGLRRRRAETCPHCHGLRPRRVDGRAGGGRRGGGHHAPCAFCRGTGLRYSVSDWDLRRKRDELEDLRDKLRRAPATVTYYDPAEWDYTVHHHEKTSDLDATFRLNTAAGKAVNASTIGCVHRDTDSTIDGANPGIGLDPDPLSLDSDASMRYVVTRTAATEAARRIIADSIGYRLVDARNRSDAATKAGRSADAFEAQIDRMSLLRPLNRKQAAELMASLRRSDKPKP